MNQGEQRKSELPVLGRINKASREKEKGMSRCAILQGFGVMSGALPSAVGKERESKFSHSEVSRDEFCPLLSGTCMRMKWQE